MFSYVASSKRMRHDDVSTAEKLETCRHLISNSACLVPCPAASVLNHAISTIGGSYKGAEVLDEHIPAFGAVGTNDECILDYWAVLSSALKSSPLALLPAVQPGFFQAAGAYAQADLIDAQVIFSNVNIINKSCITSHAILLKAIAFASSRQTSIQPLVTQVFHQFLRLLSRIREVSEAQAVAVDVLPSLVGSTLSHSQIDLLFPFLLNDQNKQRTFQCFTKLLDSPNPHVTINYLFSRFPRAHASDTIVLFRCFLDAFCSRIANLSHSAIESNSPDLTSLAALFDTMAQYSWYHPSRDTQSITERSEKRHKSGNKPSQTTAEIVRVLFLSLLSRLSEESESCSSKPWLISQLATSIASISQFSVYMIDCHVPSVFSILATKLEVPDDPLKLNVRLCVFQALFSSYAKNRSLPSFFRHLSCASTNLPSFASFKDVLGVASVPNLLGRAIVRLPTGGALSCVKALLPTVSKIRPSDIQPLSFIVALVVESSGKDDRSAVIQFVAGNFIPALARTRPCVELRAGIMFLASSIILALSQGSVKEPSAVLPILLQTDVLAAMEGGDCIGHESIVVVGGSEKTELEIHGKAVEFIVLHLSRSIANADAMTCVTAIRFLSMFVRYLLRGSDNKHTQELVTLFPIMSSYYSRLLQAVAEKETDGQTCLYWQHSPVEAAAAMLASLADIMNSRLTMTEDSGIQLLMLDYWIDHYERCSTMWNDLLECSTVRRSLGNAVCNNLMKHIRSTKRSEKSSRRTKLPTKCHGIHCSLPSILKLIRRVPPGYLTKSDEVAIHKRLVLLRGGCCEKSKSEFLKLSRHQEGCWAASLEEPIDNHNSTAYVVLLCTKTDTSSSTSIKELRERWIREWENVETAEFVFESFAKLLESGNANGTAADMVLDFLTDNMKKLEDPWLRTLQVSTGNENKQKCVLRSMASAFAIEEGLRLAARSSTDGYLRTAAFIAKMIQPVTSFAMEKLFASSMTAEGGQVLIRLCRYFWWEDNSSDQWQQRGHLLPKLIGWMTRLAEDDNDDIRRVGIKVAEELAVVADKNAIEGVVRYLLNWNEDMPLSKRRGRVDVACRVLAGSAIQLNLSLGLKLQNALLNMSYMWLQGELYAEESSCNETLHMSLEVSVLSAQGCEKLLRRGGRRLQNEPLLEPVVMSLNRLIHGVSVHADRCQPWDPEQLLAAAVNCCITLFQQGGPSLKWSCLKLGCNLVKYGSVFGGVICGKTIVRMMNAVSWSTQTQRVTTEVARSFLMECAMGVVGCQCPDFENHVVNGMASFMYNLSTTNTFSSLLTQASPSVAIVLRRAKHLADQMSYRGQ